jgi:hypothetical protein
VHLVGLYIHKKRKIINIIEVFLILRIYVPLQNLFT